MERKKGSIGLLLLAAFVVALAVNAPVSQAQEQAESMLERFQKEHKPIAPLLPPDVKIEPGFEEAKAAPVGNVQEAQGEAYVFHAGEKSAYLLKDGFPVFQGDTLVAMSRSRVNVKLHDKSAFALAPGSKIVIDKSIYDPDKKKRSSFLKLLFGRARFYVAKLQRKDVDYQVGTPTAVAGVRGSDFALAVYPHEEKTTWLQGLYAALNPVPPAYAQDPSAVLATVACTGEQTTVTFTGLVGPLQSLGPIQVAHVAPGMAASTPIQVTLGMAMQALNAVGPSLAAISMPPGAPVMDRN